MAQDNTKLCDFTNTNNNDFTINSLDVNCANNMQNSKLGDASFAMSTTCCNDHDWGDSSYDLQKLKIGRASCRERV